MSESALALLCEAYWYPLYAFARRSGHDADAAQDLTQAFFTRLLEKHYVRDARPERGRFRSFLLASFRHFLSNERDYHAAQKRGGGMRLLPLEMETAEGVYRREPPDPDTPETIYERRWALALLDRALQRLRAEQREAGHERSFDRVAGFLTGTGDDVSYAEVAAGLGTTEAAFKVTVHRMRRRFGAVLRLEIGETLADPNDVDDELRHLLAVLQK